jgi:hypothetical protein
MNENEVRVGQVFKDGDSRAAHPYFTVKKISKTHATGLRSLDLDGKVGHAGYDPLKVKIALARLIKTGTRGYSLVRGVEQAEDRTPFSHCPKPETPVEAPKVEAPQV